MNRGIRQGDAISLKHIFKELDWSGKGIKIDGEYLNHLRFADDIILIAYTQGELQEMVDQLSKKSAEIGLKFNISKTKYMISVQSFQQNTITLGNSNIENVRTLVYLGQKRQKRT